MIHATPTTRRSRSISIFCVQRATPGGRKFEIIEIPQPPAVYNAVLGTRLGFSHLNFYLANGGVILPEFGLPESDALALGIFREVFRHEEIVQVPSADLLYAGGNIHCITQQEPVA